MNDPLIAEGIAQNKAEKKARIDPKPTCFHCVV